MKRFDLTSLPIDVIEKINNIVWGEDFRYGIIGQVNLLDDWVFIDDGSHIQGFRNYQDLINMVRNNTKNVKIINEPNGKRLYGLLFESSTLRPNLLKKMQNILNNILDNIDLNDELCARVGEETYKFIEEYKGVQ